MESSLPVCGVPDDLQSAVWQQHAVLSLHDISVANGVVRVVCAVIIVLNGVVEIVRHARYVVLM
jgi:hypothetical protein